MRVAWTELTPFTRHKSYNHPLFFVKENPIHRLYEMGFIKGTIFRIVKKAFGMVQLRFDKSNVIPSKYLSLNSLFCVVSVK